MNKIRIVFILLFFLPLSLFSMNLREHLKAQYDTPQQDEEESIYWHQVPVWPQGENRRTDDPQYSSTRGGLINYTNLFSGRTMFLIIPPVPAEHMPPGETKIQVGTNFSSVYQIHDENGYAINADYEITEVFAFIDHQLTEKVDLGLLLRAFHYQAGRADKELNNFHEFFGLSTGSRGDAPNNQYANEFTKGGKTLYETQKNELGLGDMVFLVKLKALDETKNLPTISALFALKIPTGEESLGYTSQSWDPGMGLAFSKQLTKALKAHWNIGVAVPGHSPELGNLSTVYSSMAALEYYMNRWLSMVVQTNYSTSPFSDYPFEGVSEDSWTGGIGFHVRLPNNIQLHFHFTDEFYNSGDTDYVFGFAIDLWSFSKDPVSNKH